MFWRANPPPGSCFQRHRCCVCDTCATSPVMALGDPPEGLQKAAGQHQVLFSSCQSHPDPWKSTWTSPELQESPFQDLTNATQFSRSQCPLPVGLPCFCLHGVCLQGSIISSRHLQQAMGSYQALPVDNGGSGTLRTSAPQPRAVSWGGHFHLLCAFSGDF